MNKRMLLVAPAVAFCAAGMLACDDSFATDNITSGDALRTCLQDAAQESCELGGDVVLDAISHHHSSLGGGYDWYTGLSVEIANGHAVGLDLNGHKLTANIPINIENGKLSVFGGGSVEFTVNRELRDKESTVPSRSSVEPHFVITGSRDNAAAQYSVLSLEDGVEITSAENPMVKVNTSSSDLINNDRTYGSVVNILGAEITAPVAVHVSDYADWHLVGSIADNSPIINVDNGASIFTTDVAFDAGMYAHWKINNASIESESDVFSFRTGDVVIDADAKLSTDGNGAAIFDVKRSSSTDKASIVVNGGVFQSTADNGLFYTERNATGVGDHKTIGENGLKFYSGAFTVSTVGNLFSVDSDFTDAHSGFIYGGTWGNWEESEESNKYVADGFIKDIEYRGTDGNYTTIMTVVEPSVPMVEHETGFWVDASLYYVEDDYLGVIQANISRAQSEGKLEGDFEIIPRTLDVNIYDGDGNRVTNFDELADEVESANLRIPANGWVPALEEGRTRTYRAVSCHGGVSDGDGVEICSETEGEGDEVIVYDAYYDNEKDEFVIPNVRKFSAFTIIYQDAERKIPGAPNTGLKGTERDSSAAAVCSTIIYVLAGLVTSVFAAKKLFYKK